MLKILAAILMLAAMLSSVDSHAVMLTPRPRRTGPAQQALCGANLTKALEYDRAGPLETALGKVKGQKWNCDPFLCRGYQWDDNKNYYHSVVAGDVIPVKIDLIAGHKPGYANVSIVDTTVNKAIGAPLLTWAAWPGENKGPDRNDTSFNVTIPENLQSKCNVAGKCVIQWFWYVINGPQQYESCIDFVIE